MPRYINGVDIERSFTPEEIVELYNSGRLRDITLQGYVSRFDILERKCRFVPWWEANAMTPGENSGGLRQYADDQLRWEDMRKDVEREHPIRRRTPQERVAALMLRLMGEAKNADAARGAIAALGPEKVAEIMGTAWRDGDPVTAEVIQRVAAHYMAVAESSNREADRKRVTRAHATA